MPISKIREYFEKENETRPNKFTIYLGNAIRDAREEKGISQAELARLIYRRRATLSDIENGKTEPDTSTLAILAHVLDKHIGYFFPPFLYKEVKQEDLTPLENELLMHFRRVLDDSLRSMAIKQIKIISEFDPNQLFSKYSKESLSKLDLQNSLLEALIKRKK